MSKNPQQRETTKVVGKLDSSWLPVSVETLLAEGKLEPDETTIIHLLTTYFLINSCQICSSYLFSNFFLLKV